MESLWQQESATVREARELLDARLAYTTVATTLTRLVCKGLLVREKAGASFVYSAAMTRERYWELTVAATVARLLEQTPEAVLVAFVDLVAGADGRLLSLLEQMVERYRASRS